MPYLTSLAAVARRTGFPVTEVAGWTSRGHGPQPAVRGIVCHHTAGPAAGGDYPSLAVVRSGRPGLAGPLSQFGLGRSGRIYVIAAGRCWHNAPSTSGLHTNSASIGIEAENNGSQPWPEPQLDAYRRLCAELCKEYGLPASAVKAHREVNRGKPDPHGVNMADFRLAVARLMVGEQEPELEVRDGVPVFSRALKVANPLLRGADVRAWQSAARVFVPRLDVDGLYGKDSQAACKKIQGLFGVDVTGVVDEETWVLTFVVEPADLEDS
ncbi:N-acetylmuramoyl-L-alanine amidase [Acrocarpospora macrocephala]|uniref:N-acetylmuramoyl-L-alanine amidase n=1 Tax=Acrocarpospora macrocephala TaxID=150177 RepID=A0A5M3WEJ1_9ACTN|nr:N-acetylmuramoyl-L-alanine amidase [Acrocarpospora macrocephala]GES07384.1 bacteriophage protein [Acrocarpospora macrocephala]